MGLDQSNEPHFMANEEQNGNHKQHNPMKKKECTLFHGEWE